MEVGAEWGAGRGPGFPGTELPGRGRSSEPGPAGGAAEGPRAGLPRVPARSAGRAGPHNGRKRSATLCPAGGADRRFLRPPWGRAPASPGAARPPGRAPGCPPGTPSPAGWQAAPATGKARYGAGARAAAGFPVPRGSPGQEGTPSCRGSSPGCATRVRGSGALRRGPQPCEGQAVEVVSPPLALCVQGCLRTHLRVPGPPLPLPFLCSGPAHSPAAPASCLLPQPLCEGED